ncbi:MAG: PilZ domain-containing protein [Methylomarinum sp.]|nr:PilZ domain-containing protein [Methylomarinum sp.]
MMSETNRLYRKNLSSQGLIYLGGEELEITVRNLSISGLLAELDSNAVVSDIEDIFKSLKISPIIDLYLPEMRLAGEAEVVRADIVKGHIYMGLEFSNITYDVDNSLYKRHAYRKNLAAPGQIVLNGNKYQFNTENVSVDGLMIHLQENIAVDVGTVSIFDFKRLQLRGEIKVVWVDHREDGSTLMGLQYLHMEKENIKGIPQFTPIDSSK